MRVLWLSGLCLSLSSPQVWLSCPAPAWASSWAATSSRSWSWELVSRPSWRWSAAASPCSASPRCSSWAARASTWEASTSPTPPGKEGRNSGKRWVVVTQRCWRRRWWWWAASLQRSRLMWIWVEHWSCFHSDVTVEDGEEVEMKTESSKDKQTAKDEIKKKKTPTERKTELWKRLRERERGQVEKDTTVTSSNT